MADDPITPSADTTGDEVAEEAPVEPDLKSALHTERQTIKALRKQIEEFQAEQEKARQAALSEHERAVEEAKKAGYADAEKVYRAEARKARVSLHAAKVGFLDPDDAAVHLDLDSLDDDKAIAKAVAALVEAKPYLVGRTSSQSPLSQGPQGAGPSAESGDFLRALIRDSRKR